MKKPKAEEPKASANSQAERILALARQIADYLNDSHQLNPPHELIRELCQARRLEVVGHV
jgi:hypothetical protein